MRLSKTPDQLYDLVADPFEYSKLPLASLTPEQDAAYRRLDGAMRGVAILSMRAEEARLVV